MKKAWSSFLKLGSSFGLFTSSLGSDPALGLGMSILAKMTSNHIEPNQN